MYRIMQIIRNLGLLKLDGVKIVNTVFLLHCKVTTTFLIISSVVLTSKQYFGEPINCIFKAPVVEQSAALNLFCWLFSTFTLANRTTDSVLSIHPGVGTEDLSQTTIKHSYYQWLGFVLGLQALLFYCPYALWKIWEGGRLKHLVSGLNGPLEEWTKPKKDAIIRYLLNRPDNLQNLHFTKYLLCQFLNICNIVLQFCFLNKLFNNQYLTYGFDVLKNQEIDQMDVLFPKVSKCKFTYFGPSGSVQHLDAVCILPLNIMAEKIFLIFWYWSVLLLILTFFNLCFDLFAVFNPLLRIYLLQARATYIPRYNIDFIVRNNTIGCWFFLLQVVKNINTELLEELITEMSNNKKNFVL